MNRILDNGIQSNEEKQFYLDYLNHKMQNLINKNKKELKEEIEYVNSLHFKKEKEEKNANYHEERYILGTKEKTTIYKRIADIIVKLKDVNNQEKMQQLITKVQNIL